MRKLFTVMALGAAMVAANAQTTVAGSKFTDNWSLGIIGGVTTPTTHHAFFADMRPTIGLEATKMLTPVFGFGFEGRTTINTPFVSLPYAKHVTSKTIFDGVSANLLGKVNLNNLFHGYKGTPDVFEVEAVAGIGYTHMFTSGYENVDAPEYAYASGAAPEYWNTKFGLNFNFNLGAEKAWVISIKPAIVYAMNKGKYDADFTPRAKTAFNVNDSYIDITAGVAYKFKNSNGTHNFALVKPYDQAEVDGLNAKINDLRGQLNDANSQLANAKNANGRLQKELNDCRNQKPVVKEVSSNKCESVVSFRQGKSVIDASQMPNVERVATYLKNHSDAKVSIKGYASPEGPLAVNKKLAEARANAVKNTLVKKYKIDASRIDAAGQGIGKMFSEPAWNRVSICTLDGDK